MNRDPDDLLLAYAEAQAAIERMEERMCLSPVREAWEMRMAAVEREALALLDSGHPSRADRGGNGRTRLALSNEVAKFWQHAHGRAIAPEALLSDLGALISWLGLINQAYFKLPPTKLLFVSGQCKPGRPPAKRYIRHRPCCIALAYPLYGENMVRLGVPIAS